jgi:hypothetical protein
MQYLSDLEQEKIIAFNQDTVLVDAVRKVLLAAIYTNGTLRKDLAPEPTKNAALSLAFYAMANGSVTNDALGEDLRALAQAVRLLEGGLAQLSSIKPEPVGEVSPANPGI